MVHMEIVSVSGQSLRIKGKTVTTLVTPVLGKSKVAADVILFHNRSHEAVDVSAVEGLKLIVDGPGDYEVGGMKISAQRIGDDVIYSLFLDGIEILITKASTSEKMKDGLKDCQIAVFLADAMAEQRVVTSLNATMTVFYGEQAVANAKAFGKEDAAPVAKVSVTREKLPTEAEIIVLE